MYVSARYDIITSSHRPHATLTPENITKPACATDILKGR